MRIKMPMHASSVGHIHLCRAVCGAVSQRFTAVHKLKPIFVSFHSPPFEMGRLKYVLSRSYVTGSGQGVMRMTEAL